MDGVGETGAETLPSLQSSGAGLGGVAYFASWGELAQAQARVGPPTNKGLHLAVFSAESGTGRPDASHPRAAQKKKRIPKKERRARRAVSCTLRVVLIVSMPRQKAAVLAVDEK